jgi:hypothetical protein
MTKPEFQKVLHGNLEFICHLNLADHLSGHKSDACGQQNQIQERKRNFARLVGIGVDREFLRSFARRSTV